MVDEPPEEYNDDADLDYDHWFDDLHNDSVGDDSAATPESPQDEQGGEPPQPPPPPKPDDPLPGHPAGQHNSPARSKVLQTWNILSDWVRIPTKVAAQKPRGESTAKKESHAQMLRDISDAAAAQTPCIPCSHFVGEVKNYKFGLVKDVLGYHSDLIPTAPSDQAPSDASDAQPTPIHISGLLLQAQPRRAPTPKPAGTSEEMEPR